MKAFLLLLIVLMNFAWALEAPALRGLRAVNDTCARLSWHWPDPGIEGTVVYRFAAPGLITFTRFADVNAPDSVFLDTTVLPALTYYYCVATYVGADTSPKSSYLSITMPGIARKFEAAVLEAQWDSVKRVMNLSIYDYATTELGWVIYKGDVSGTYVFFDSVLSPVPTTTGSVKPVLVDSFPLVNTWNLYKIVTYNYTQRDSSVSVVYAGVGTIPPGKEKKLVLGEKYAEIGIRLLTWAAQHGDTVIVCDSSIIGAANTLLDINGIKNPPHTVRRNFVPDINPEMRNRSATYYCTGPMVFQVRFDSTSCYRASGTGLERVARPSTFFRGMYAGPTLDMRVVGSPDEHSVIVRSIETTAMNVGTCFYNNSTFRYLGCYSYGYSAVPCGVHRTTNYFNRRLNVLFARGDSTGGTCSYDSLIGATVFTFNYQNYPPMPVVTYPKTVPDTITQEYNGFTTADTAVTRAKLVFVDSVKSLAFIFRDTTLSIYSTSPSTHAAPLAARTAATAGQPRIKIDRTGRCLSVAPAPNDKGRSYQVRLFSMTGRQVFGGAVEAGKKIILKQPMRGVIVGKIEGEGGGERIIIVQ